MIEGTGYRLEDVLRTYRVVLFDSSVIQGSLKSNSTAPSHQEKLRRKYDSIRFFTKNTGEESFYVTPKVLDELYPRGLDLSLGVSSNLRNEYQRRARSGRINPSDKEFGIRKFQVKISRGLKTFIERVKVLFLTEEERRYAQDISQYYPSLGLNLHDTDKDLLASAFACSRVRGITAIVCNDLPLLSAWNSFGCRNHFAPEMLSFFCRTKFDEFVRASLRR